VRLDADSVSLERSPRIISVIDFTPRQQRLALIDAIRQRTDILLSGSNEKRVNTSVRYAVRDLDEAVVWLRRQNIDTAPHLLRMVDIAIRCAATRLASMESLAVNFVMSSRSGD
jgi:hypothetical protein